MADERTDDEVTTSQSPEHADGPSGAARPRRVRAAAKPETTSAVGTSSGVTVPAAGNVEIIEGGARDVRAETLSIQQGGVNMAEARQIDIRQGGIGRARADDIAVTQGAIGMARGERVSVDMGAVGLAVGNEVRVTQGFAQSVLAREVRIEQGGARAVVAGRVAFERNSGVLMLFAGKVEGNVRTVLDWRGALVFGAAFGLVAGLVRRRR